ncbi:transcription factor bHLH14 [Tanacetum coccineum]
MMSKERKTHARENSAPPYVVLTDDDLLTKILIRLPILCIHLFTTISKQWLRILTSPVFTLNRRKITRVDPLVDYADDDLNFYGCAGLRLAFDPTKSPYYKVSIKYIFDIDDFMSPLLEGWSIRSIIWSIVLGEREEDSFLVINLSGNVVEYNLISKTLREIYDMGSNQVADDYLDSFIPPFAIYDMGYKKVDHKVYEFIPSSASV